MSMTRCIKTHLEIREELYTKLGAPPHSPLRDSTYLCPHMAWVETYLSWLADGLGEMPQVKEAWDCDDYMMWAIVEAARCKAEGSMNPFLGFSLCGVYLRISPTATQFLGIPLVGNRAVKSHACILLRVADADGGKWWVIEPQTSQKVLYEEAINSDLVVSVDYVLGL